MPHYRDGSEARLGDLVAGVSYNRGGRKIVGTVVGVTPGAETCNCRVAFVAEADLSKQYGPISGVLTQVAVAMGGASRQAFLRVEDDYGETRAFDLIARAGETVPAKA